MMTATMRTIDLSEESVNAAVGGETEKAYFCSLALPHKTFAYCHRFISRAAAWRFDQIQNRSSHGPKMPQQMMKVRFNAL
jgi:hypothetical protein